eukprot:3518978-Pleurochrysis_carterae.AAC.1
MAWPSAWHGHRHGMAIGTAWPSAWNGHRHGMAIGMEWASAWLGHRHGLGMGSSKRQVDTHVRKRKRQG